jgi:cation diffusion facilitator family transporter
MLGSANKPKTLLEFHFACYCAFVSNDGALKTQAVRIAVLGGLLVFSLKLVGYALSNSVGLLSDALESTVNVGAAALTAWTVSIAARPPDQDHPYGHDKAEYLSSTLEGLLVGAAGVLILTTAIGNLQSPKVLNLTAPTLIVTVSASVFNFLLGQYLIRVGKRTSSIALEADGRHVLSDVLTSLGVIAGVILAAVTRISWIDPLIALLVALSVIVLAFNLVRRSVGGLMDTALSSNDQNSIRGVLEVFKHRYLEVHDLRSRSSGAKKFIDFHLIMPGESSVQAAHDLCDAIENALLEKLPDSSITIHVEPQDFVKGNAPDLRF